MRKVDGKDTTGTTEANGFKEIRFAGGSSSSSRHGRCYACCLQSGEGLEIRFRIEEINSVRSSGSRVSEPTYTSINKYTVVHSV